MKRLISLPAFSSAFSHISGPTPRTGLVTSIHFNNPIRAFRHNTHFVRNVPSSLQLFPLASTSFVISAVPVFDGSTIHDPVVVSSLYWSNIWHGFNTWFLTQFIVGIVASIALVFSTSQLIALGEYISAQTNRLLDNRENNPSVVDIPYKPSSTNTKLDRVIKLAVCIAIDLTGSISELVPVLGGVLDILWAPIAAFTLRSLYAGSNTIFVIELLEEILPFTDFIPIGLLRLIMMIQR